MTDYLPIPDRHVRVSVQFADELHCLDLPADSIDATVQRFEQRFAITGLPEMRYSAAGSLLARDVAGQAMLADDTEAVVGAALWIMMHPLTRREGERQRKRLQRLIDRDGGAFVIAVCNGFSRGWSVSICPMHLANFGDIANPSPAALAGATVQ